MAVLRPVSSYVEAIPIALPGQVADTNTYTADTLICETAAGIPFGVVVGQGTSHNEGVLGAAAVTGFRGISVRQVVMAPVAAQGTPQADYYPRYANMAVMFRGDIWVVADGAVTAGQDVTFVPTTGLLGSIAADATHLLITGARWMTSASGGGLAICRLSGAIPVV